MYPLPEDDGVNKQYKVPEHPFQILKGHTGPVYVAKFNKEGQYCVSGSQDRSAILWNPSKGSMIKQYKGKYFSNYEFFKGPHNYEILDICISKDSAKFASVGGDKQAFIWDVTTSKIIRKFTGHHSRINTCMWNYEDTVLATGSYDGTLRLWDMKSNSTAPIEMLKNFKDSVSKVIVMDNEIIASSVDGNIRTFDIRNGEIITDNLFQAIHSFDISHDQKCFAASCLDNKLRLIEKNSGEILQDYIGHKSDNYSIGCKFSFNDAHIISGSEDGFVYVFDVLQGKFIKKMKAHSRVVCGIDICQKGETMLTSSFDHTIVYWKFPNQI